MDKNSAETPKNTGVPYERITKEIFKRILHSTDNGGVFTNIDVRHKVRLTGRTTEHDVDVYWEFEAGGIIYKTIVEARDWSSKIKKDNLLAFRARLDDIPGQPRGIYVTTTGYQSGALEVANSHGIELFVLQPKSRPPIKLSTLGFAKIKIRPEPVSEEAPLGLVLECIAYDTVFTNLSFQVDKHDGDAQFVKSISLSISLREVKIFDENGIENNNVENILRPILNPLHQTPNCAGSISHIFEEASFIQLPNSGEKRRLRKIIADLEFRETQRSVSPLDYPDIKQFVLEKIAKREQHVFRYNIKNDGTI